MIEIPENKFHIFYDHDAGHYRVLLDGVDLSMNVAFGGVKVDFSTQVEPWDLPTVTLSFPANEVEVVLADGTKVDGGVTQVDGYRDGEPKQASA